MTVSADTLLEGPRGRRLCLEWASALEPELRTAVFHASHDLDPGRGTTVWLTSSGQGELPVMTAQDVARALETMRVSEPTVGSVIDALAESAAFARYWQDPDGEDVLALQPELGVGLQRIADTLAPIIDEFSTPAHEEQWAIDWHDSPVELPDPSDETARRLARWRDAEQNDERMARAERPRDPRANWSGHWWSIPPADVCLSATRAVDDVPLGLSLIEDGFGWKSAAAHPVSLPPRVLELGQVSFRGVTVVVP